MNYPGQGTTIDGAISSRELPDRRQGHSWLARSSEAPFEVSVYS